MDRSITYKGCVIDASPKELADGSGWTGEYCIDVHVEGRVETRPYYSDRKFKTKDEAIAACHEMGKKAHRPIPDFT